MPRILLRNYSSYFDPKSKTQFSPVLDRRTGCYVAVADLTTAAAKQFEGRPGFETLSDAELLQMSAEAEEEPGDANTGDPLTRKSANTTADKSQSDNAGPPPPPPGG